MSAGVAIFVDAWPELSETFIAAEAAALRDLGFRVRVEARGPALYPHPDPPAGVPVSFFGDDGTPARLAALARLAVRHPLRVFRDVVARRAWRRQERVMPLRVLAPLARRAERHGTDLLHAHFAAGAALDALRLGRLLGRPFSVTAHAYEIYRERQNLEAKLAEAAFATSGCDYTVRDLRARAPTAQVHRIVMGVDAERFRRTTPYPGGRRVVAVGRLVPKKGFGDLVEAAALLRDRAPLDRVVIVGEGPERHVLEAAIARHGLAGVVELPGPQPPEAIRAELERAAVLAMPCVVAADGDRDSQPVVVKEALAMEVPVVATDEVGLPEIVRPAWGRLAPPGDPAGLAAALEDLLAQPVEVLAAMGQAGREHVLAHADVRRETARLAELIEAAVGAGWRSRRPFRP